MQAHLGGYSGPIHPSKRASRGVSVPLASVRQGLGPALLVEQRPQMPVAASVSGAAKNSCGQTRCGCAYGREVGLVAAPNQGDQRRVATTQLERDGEGGADGRRVRRHRNDGSKGGGR